MKTTIIVKYTIRETILQPLFLFVVLVELVTLLLMIFGFELEYEERVLVSLRLLGGVVHDQVRMVVDSLASTSFVLTTHILAFLFILMSSSFYSDLLRNPLLGILLTKSVSRVELFLARFAGFLLTVAANIILFASVLAVILAIKGDGSVSLALIAGAGSFCVEFLLLFSLCAFLTMVADHPFGIAVVVLGIYYLVGPLVAGTDASSPIVTRAVSLLLPPTGILENATREIVLHGAKEYAPLNTAVPYVALYLVGGAMLFHRRDLK